MADHGYGAQGGQGGQGGYGPTGYGPTGYGNYGYGPPSQTTPPVSKPGLSGLLERLGDRVARRAEPRLGIALAGSAC